MRFPELAFFKGDSYHTPENTHRYLLDKLMFGGRWVFVIKYLGIVFRKRKIAIKGIYDDKEWVKSSVEIFRLIENCGGRFHIEGLNNLTDLNKPAVFVSNHMSILETMVFPSIIAPVLDVTFVMKDSLIKHKLAGPIMRSRNPIVVGRTNSREDFSIVMQQGKELIDNGTSIVIFPQTTRTSKFVPEKFNSLGIKLAKKSNVQIVPIAIKTDFWANGKGAIKDLGPINRKKPIYIKIGEPLDIKGNGKAENDTIINFIDENLKNWQD